MLWPALAAQHEMRRGLDAHRSAEPECRLLVRRCARGESSAATKFGIVAQVGGDVAFEDDGGSDRAAHPPLKRPSPLGPIEHERSARYFCRSASGSHTTWNG